MRVLQIGADRSKRGILFPGSPAFLRQEAYARVFGQLDIVAFSLRSDSAQFTDAGPLRVFPTNTPFKLLYGFYTIHIARTVPKPDVISAQDPFETGLIAWVVAALLRVPLHVQVHINFLSPDFSRTSVNKLRVFIAGFVLRRASRIRAVSEEIRKTIVQRYGLHVPVSVLPIYVDIARYRDAVPNAVLVKRFERFTWKLLVVSRLVEPQKNIALAVRSFAALAARDACLIIVGTGEEEAALKTLAERLGISDRVFFEGEHDPAPYYKLADLFLLTSRYEGYGMVVIEALAAGKPVLATDVGIAREAGAIITSEEEFAAALSAWIANGPRAGVLKQYPYKNLDDYVRQYCNDVQLAR